MPYSIYSSHHDTHCQPGKICQSRDRSGALGGCLFAAPEGDRGGSGRWLIHREAGLGGPGSLIYRYFMCLKAAGAGLGGRMSNGPMVPGGSGKERTSRETWGGGRVLSVEWV